MEYIRETVADGEELVLLEGTDAELMNESPDPRRTSLRLRREALASSTSSSSNSSKPIGH